MQLSGSPKQPANFARSQKRQSANLSKTKHNNCQIGHSVLETSNDCKGAMITGFG